MEFDVISSRSIEEPPTIKVTFANGIQDDLELSHFKMNSISSARCSYTGQLRNDPSSTVAVTGCLDKAGDEMEVTMISNNNINKMFLVDFDGNVKVIENPFEDGTKKSVARRVDRNDDEWRQNGDEMINDEEEAFVRSAQASVGGSIPAKIKATVKFGYEDGMKAALEKHGRNFDDWIADVFTHAQVHFRHSSSLGTQIEFEVQYSLQEMFQSVALLLFKMKLDK